MQQQVLDRIVEVCTEEASVSALWLEGSWADNNHDELSDIDIWIDVLDEAQGRVWDLVVQTLREFGDIDLDLALGSGRPQVTMRTFHIAGRSGFETYDINMQAQSGRRVFVKGIHKVKPILDKAGAIKWREADQPAIDEMMSRRAAELRQFFMAGVPLIQKQVIRGNYMEAYLHYGHWCLTPLVDLARIKYAPNKLDNFIKHIYDDLPEEVTKLLEPLFRVSTLGDISKHLLEAQVIIAQF